MGLLLALSFSVWTNFTQLAESNGLLEESRVAAGPNGHAVAIWYVGGENTHRLMARIFTPGGGWSAAEPITEPDAFPVPRAAAAVAADGTVVAAWREQVDSPPFPNLMITRKYTPGSGWGPKQILSTEGWQPTLVMAPDGRAHIVFFDHWDFGARTLAPGEETWSDSVLLGTVGLGNSQGPAMLAASNGVAYATFTAQNIVWLAKYDAAGWHPAQAVPVGDGHLGYSGGFLENSGRIALLWGEQTDVPPYFNAEHVRWLTEDRPDVTLPTSDFYNVALLPDNSLLAINSTRGDPVPGCGAGDAGANARPKPSNGGPYQAYYSYLEAWRRPPDGGWTGPEVVSDPHKHIVNPLQWLNATGHGDVFATWSSDVPCQSGSGEALTRVFSSSKGAWEPVTRLSDASLQLDDLAADGHGTVRALLLKWTDFGTPQLRSEVLTAEIPARSSVPGDLNADGKVDCADLAVVRASFGAKAGELRFDPRADVNGDGVVDDKDLSLAAQALPAGMQCPNAQACYFGVTAGPSLGRILALVGNLTYQAESDRYLSVQAVGRRARENEPPEILDLSDAAIVRGNPDDTVAFSNAQLQLQFNLPGKTITGLMASGLSVPLISARLICQ